MKKVFSLVLLAMLLFPLAGCDEDAFVVNAYKIISTSGTVYDAGMKASARAYASGSLSVSQYMEIKKAAEVYYETYELATRALAAYNDTRDEAKRQAVDGAVDAMKRNLDRFCAVAWKFGVSVAPEEER